jgi:dihydroneopterin aldolase
MGIITIEGMQFYAHHGYYKEEQVLGGKYTVDVFLDIDFDEAATTDNLQKTINYETIYLLTKAEMDIPAKLIEHVCSKILLSIKQRFPLAIVTVKLSKYNPPLKGNVEKVTVTLSN